MDDLFIRPELDELDRSVVESARRARQQMAEIGLEVGFNLFLFLMPFSDALSFTDDEQKQMTDAGMTAVMDTVARILRERPQ